MLDTAVPGLDAVDGLADPDVEGLTDPAVVGRLAVPGREAVPGRDVSSVDDVSSPANSCSVARYTSDFFVIHKEISPVSVGSTTSSCISETERPSSNFKVLRCSKTVVRELNRVRFNLRPYSRDSVDDAGRKTTGAVFAEYTVQTR